MMQPIVVEEVRHASPRAKGYLGRVPIMVLAPVLLGGCVQVTAPAEPIEINLNINIRQEVVISLREDVRELIERNPGVF